MRGVSINQENTLATKINPRMRNIRLNNYSRRVTSKKNNLFFVKNSFIPPKQKTVEAGNQTEFLDTTRLVLLSSNPSDMDRSVASPVYQEERREIEIPSISETEDTPKHKRCLSHNPHTVKSKTKRLQESFSDYTSASEVKEDSQYGRKQSEIIHKKKPYVPMDAVLQELILNTSHQNFKVANTSSTKNQPNGGAQHHGNTLTKFKPKTASILRKTENGKKVRRLLDIQQRKVEGNPLFDLPYLTEGDKNSFISHKIHLVPRMLTFSERSAKAGSEAASQPASNNLQPTHAGLPKLRSEVTKSQRVGVKSKLGKELRESVNDGTYESDSEY